MHPEPVSHYRQATTDRFVLALFTGPRSWRRTDLERIRTFCVDETNAAEIADRLTDAGKLERIELPEFDGWRLVPDPRVAVFPGSLYGETAS